MQILASRSRVCVVVFLMAPALLAGGCGMVDRITGVNTACDLRKTGVAAEADILKIWDTGMTVNDNPVIGMRVRVRAQDRPPFEADIPKSLIGRLTVSRFQPGEQVEVVYDAHDPSKIGLDIYRCD